jgi:ribosomal protein S18 acetylase RimI-like enzyme
MSPLAIRTFEPDDADQLLAVHRAAILAAESYSLAQRQSWALKLSAENYRTIFPAQEMCDVAVIDGRVAGFCSYAGDRIFGLYVHPQSQGRGVGSALLRRGESVLRDGGAERLHIHASLSAADFYIGQGYVEVRRRQHVTGGGLALDTVDMEKPLPSHQANVGRHS